MGREKAPAEGDRIDIGGKLPQFDVFASFAYRELINDNLTWVRVADPKAEKLDDIQYATNSAIHAYQLKWSNQNNPPSFSYNDFKPLFFECISGWKALKSEHATEHKKTIAHLLTNRSISTKDSIKDGDIKIGSFDDFLTDVWKRLKIRQDYDSKWKPIVDSLISESGLTAAEFIEFIDHFEFHPDYNHHEFRISNISTSKLEEDLLHMSRFLLEEVADKKRTIHYSFKELINALGPAWQIRFKTTFNHELIIDKSNYQPIISTLNELDQKVEDLASGYIFIVGGPGTGKSTLLTDWSKNRGERVIKYYAFDFTNPSSLLNDHERGEAVNLFFDLVFQLKNTRLLTENIQPYKDLIYLKSAFERQLQALGDDYRDNSTKTIIIIDGLDHIPREYTQTSNSLLSHLPAPSALPEGVFIILGSQSYELNDLRQEIKLETENTERVVQIALLERKEVLEFLESLDRSNLLSEDQKQLIYEKSQGHPLYLSYLTQRILQSEDINAVIDNIDVIDGDITIYYRKIWEPISENNSLVELLGLIARVNGSVSPEFIKEWGFDHQVLSSLRKNAKFLFDQSYSGWSFFHNSFRQFLIHNTSLDPLSGSFDAMLSMNYHDRLAHFYTQSQVEKSWKKSYHLYSAGRHEEFLIAAHPNEFVNQFLNFRPTEEIRRDIKLGIEIAKDRLDPYLLARYLFALSELERRLFNIDPASFLKEFLDLGKIEVAKNYLRSGKTLFCSESFALRASRLFTEYEDKVESNILFNLAEPEYVSENGIRINDNHRYDEVKDTLEEWCQIAPYFYDTTEILNRINNIEITTDERGRPPHENESNLRIELLDALGVSLIKLERWTELELILSEFDLSERTNVNVFFGLLRYGIEESLDQSNNTIAEKLLAILLKYFTIEKSKPTTRIFIADLIYQVTGDLDLVKNWILDVQQPVLPNWDRFGYEGSLDPFLPKIKLNKLLNLCGEGVPITVASPNAKPGSDEEIAVEYERMLCLTTQILGEGILKTQTVGKITNRILPIIKFYYRDVSHRNSYWFRLTQAKSEYFNFLIYSVSLLGEKELNELGEYFIEEFSQSPKYWSDSLKRDILISLLEAGFDKERLKGQLVHLESTMLEGHDVSGRIDECISHVKAWIKLSDSTQAKKWIQNAIKESLGVGYRKDYQFSSWIKWLQKINDIDPTKSKERILWFLSHLRHIEETTEGRAYVYATEEILQTTFQWNFHAGRQQLEWQLDNELIRFQDAELVFIQHYLKNIESIDQLEHIINFYTQILLFVHSGSSEEIISLILSRGFDLGGNEFLGSYLPKLVNAINIKALEEIRHDLLKVIDDFAKSNSIKVQDYIHEFNVPINSKRSSDGDSQNTLILKENHVRLTELQVFEKVEDFNSFKELVELEDQRNSFFKWDKILDRVAPTFTIEQIKELSQFDRLGRKESDFFARLSQYALNLGDKKIALELAERSVSLSNDYGWNKWYDGGTRITAFEALKKVEPDYATKKAFEFLAYDGANQSDPGQLCQQFDEILPSITTEYNVKQIWEEVFDHLKRLMETSSPIDDLPDLINLKRPISEDLTDHLLFLCKNPVNIIYQNAQKLLALNVTIGDHYTLTKLRELNGGDEQEQETLIHILMMLEVLQKDGILEHFIDELNSLAISKNYSIRNYASRILINLNNDIPIPEKRELPMIYSLYLEETQKLDFGKEEDPLNPQFDLNDPEDLVRPYGLWLEMLVDKTGFEKVNLIQRMVSIMREIDDAKKWTSEYAEQINHHLREINLKYSNPRPRARTAKRALMHMVTELIDTGELEQFEIEGYFHMHDHAIHFLPEDQKPNFIPRLMELGRFSPPQEWLSQIEQSERLSEGLIEMDNWYVIGELSKVRSLAWDKSTESYMSNLTARNVEGDVSYHIFGSAFEILTKDYYESSVAGRNIIVTRNHQFDQFDEKSRWIAINPVLARYLKWIPSPNHLFGWEDTFGNLMAYSVYWADGNIDMPPPHHDFEVGQGWFVLATKEAIDQIQTAEPDLVIKKELKRYRWNDGVYQEEKRSQTVEIN